MVDIIGDMFPEPSAGGLGSGATRLYMFNTKKAGHCDVIDRMFLSGIVKKWQYVPEVRHHPARLLVEADYSKEFAGYIIGGMESPHVPEEADAD